MKNVALHGLQGPRVPIRNDIRTFAGRNEIRSSSSLLTPVQDRGKRKPPLGPAAIPGRIIHLFHLRPIAPEREEGGWET